MATAPEENPFEGGGLGTGGKFRKRPFRRTQTTPYDRPPTALRNPSRNNGWFSKLVDPAQRLITSSAHWLFSSVFRKRLPPPPPTQPQPLSSEAEQEPRGNHKEAAASVTSDSSGKQQGALGESDTQTNYSDIGGLTELEKLLEKKNFTRSEIDHLTTLLHSRTVESPVREEERMEVVPLKPLLSHEPKKEYPSTPALDNGIESHLASTPCVSSSAINEGIASPAELAKAYMENRPSKVSPSMLGLQSPTMREDSITLSCQQLHPKSLVMSILPRATSHVRITENAFMTPRSRGRTAIYNMAQTPYARVYPTSMLKGAAGLTVEGGPSSSAQSALGHNMLSGSNQALKRRSSVLDNDIGSVGPIRRIRQKSNLLSSKGLSLPATGSPLSIPRNGVGTDASQQPSSSLEKSLLLGETKLNKVKFSTENVDDTMPSTSCPALPSKSSEMASKILQQLDKLVSPKEKLSELKLPTLNDKSATKLSPSMLRGQALRSMETVDSSKFLDNIQEKKSDNLLENLYTDAQKLASQKNKVENGPVRLVSPSDGLVSATTKADVTTSSRQLISSANSLDSFTMKSISHPPQKKSAFHMSVHEDYFELDDDAYHNGAVSSTSTFGKEVTGSTALGEKTNCVTETVASEKPPASPIIMPSQISALDDKTCAGTADESLVGEKVNVSSSTTSSTPSPTFKPVSVATPMQSDLGSGKSASLNGSIMAPPVFNFGSKMASSMGSTPADATSKDSAKSVQINFGDEVVSSKESVADFGVSKSVDKFPQMPFTFSSSSVGAESVGLKFGGFSDSQLGNIVSSTTGSVATDLMPKVSVSDIADVKTSTDVGFSVRSSELAVSSTASTLTTSATSMFSFGHNLNQNNGPSASSPSFSSPFAPLGSNNFTSQNTFSSSILAAGSTNTDTSASTITAMTASTPAATASSNSSSSTSVVACQSATTSVFKFGSSPSPSIDLPSFSTGSKPVETKSKQDAGFGNLSSAGFGSSSASVGSTGSSATGFSSSAVTTTVNSHSQGSIFGPSNGSVLSSQAAATTGFAASTQSQSIPFGSSMSSPLFGLSVSPAFSSVSLPFTSSSTATNMFNSGPSFGLSMSASSSAANAVSSNSATTSSATFSSGSLPFASSSAATNMFNSGPSFGLSTSASSSAANSVSSNSGTTSSVFPHSSWPSKSPFGSTFSSSSGFSFGATTASVASTSSPMIFGSSTSASSTPLFSFTPSVTNASTQTAFTSPSSIFPFNSASSVNNDQMSMEDSMAEDTVQTTPPAAPVFGQQPASTSKFVFGATVQAGPSPFQFASQQNIAPQNPSPFQASGSLEFNPGGSFSLGTGGGDKSGRKYVKVKHKQRKK